MGRTTFAPMFKSWPVVALLAVAMFTTSCSKYQKIVKSNDFEKKLEMAKVYFDQKKYAKAFPLFEELINFYKGTSRAEEVYYYYAYTHFHMGDLELASYHFGNYVKTFPKAPRAEECQFMTAKSYYLSSPDPDLDQEFTRKALTEMQIFINRYPTSPRVEECNNLMDRLRYKLENKSYKAAKLYYKVGEYKAAIFALRNTIKDFPESRYREEMTFMILRSSFLWAENSIESKQIERYEATIKEYDEFVSRFPDSRQVRDADVIKENSLKRIEKLRINESKNGLQDNKRSS